MWIIKLIKILNELKAGKQFHVGILSSSEHNPNIEVTRLGIMLNLSLSIRGKNEKIVRIN